MGAYNIAYNVAGMASGIVVDQVSEVLVPTFRRATEDKRAAALLRGTTLVALSAMPLAIGLAAVAPSIVAAFVASSWQEVAPMLTILSTAAGLSPVAALLLAYFQACVRPKLVMYILLFSAATVVATVATIGRLGPLWACGAVLFTTVLTVLACARALRSLDGIRVTALLATQLPALRACVPMVAAVLLARLGLDAAGVEQRHLRLALEVLAGGATYVAAALLLSRAAARDLLSLLRAALRSGG
jgi:PST family polysaccharide transporter/lipopolysaccharide exporter